MAYIGVSPSNGVRRVHTYTATASQTTFSGAGAEGTSLSYKDSNFVDVYQNGVKLGDADYTATSGTSIVLDTGATASDLVVIVVFDVFSVADTVSKADGGTFDGAVTFAGGVSGVLDADDGITVDNITIDGTEIDLSSGDLTIDVAGDIILDADGGDVNFQDGGTLYGFMAKSSNDLLIGNAISDGDVLIRGNDGGSNISAVTFDMSNGGDTTFNSNVRTTFIVQSGIGSGANCRQTTASGNHAYFASQYRDNSGNVVGSVQVNTTSTTFNTSSDYRLKDNISYDFDATSRLKQLKPARFNWKKDTDTTVDGFIAHEVSNIVPEAITGSKDATQKIQNVVLNADGSFLADNISEKNWTKGKANKTYAEDTKWVASKTVPDYQSIDQSKLVPLLTKTLQEALTRIDTLEAEVKALKGE